MNSKEQYIVIISFLTGILFGPYSQGLFWLILFLIGYEIITYIGGRMGYIDWNPETRLLVVIFSLAGWVISRSLVGFSLTSTGKVPKMVRDPEYNEKLINKSYDECCQKLSALQSYLGQRLNVFSR